LCESDAVGEAGGWTEPPEKPPALAGGSITFRAAVRSTHSALSVPSSAPFTPRASHPWIDWRRPSGHDHCHSTLNSNIPIAVNLIPRINLRRRSPSLPWNFGCRRALRGDLHPTGNGKHVSIHLFHNRNVVCHDDYRQRRETHVVSPGLAGRNVSTHSFAPSSIEPCRRQPAHPIKSSDRKTGRGGGCSSVPNGRSLTVGRSTTTRH